MIFTVTLNPSLDKTAEISNFQTDTVNRITFMRVDPGGKGINVSKVVNCLGGESKAFALLGGATGTEVEKQTKALGVNLSAYEVDGETRTNLKIVDPQNHTNTDINEPGPFFQAEKTEVLFQALIKSIQFGDIVVLAGSLPPRAPHDLYASWIDELKQKGAKVFLDADGDAFRLGVNSAPYLVKPNLLELSNLMGKSLSAQEEIISAAWKLMQVGIERVVVSMGADGALFVSKEKTIAAKGVKVPVRSTVGAGDSMVAALAYGEDASYCMENSARLAIASSAANVMCSGTQAADRRVVDRILPEVQLELITERRD